jgi:hypothetical protein
MRYAYAVLLVTESVTHLTCISESHCRNGGSHLPPQERSTRGTGLRYKPMATRQTGNSKSSSIERELSNVVSGLKNQTTPRNNRHAGRSNACEDPARGVAGKSDEHRACRRCAMPTSNNARQIRKAYHATAFPPPFKSTCREHLCRPQQQ